MRPPFLFSFPWDVLPKPHPQPQYQCPIWEQDSGSNCPFSPPKPHLLSEPKEALSDLVPSLCLHHSESSNSTPSLPLSPTIHHDCNMSPDFCQRPSCHQVWFLLRPRSLACWRLPPYCLFTRPSLCTHAPLVCLFVTVSCCKDTSHVAHPSSRMQ